MTKSKKIYKVFIFSFLFWIVCIHYIHLVCIHYIPDIHYLGTNHFLQDCSNDFSVRYPFFDNFVGGCCVLWQLQGSQHGILFLSVVKFFNAPKDLKDKYICSDAADDEDNDDDDADDDDDDDNDDNDADDADDDDNDDADDDDNDDADDDDDDDNDDADDDDDDNNDDDDVTM